MTVIAYKAGVMAADTMLSAYNSQHRAQKIVRLPDGGVAGGCGQWNRAWAGLKYLADGGDMDASSLLSEGGSFCFLPPASMSPAAAAPLASSR